MRKIVLISVIAAVACVFASCGNKNANSDAQANDSTLVASNAYTLDALLDVAEENLGKTVTVKGSVTHTCKHAGKKCFIVGENEDVSMRIEAKGNIGGFNRELVGSEIAVKGILKKGNTYTKEELTKAEDELKAKVAQEDASGEACDVELDNIKKMKAWMEAKGKDSYSNYYLDGEEFEVIKNK